MISPICSADLSRLLARLIRYAGNRHQVFRPQLHRLACELLSRFQEGLSEPISYEALQSLRQRSRVHKVAENFYLSDKVLPFFRSASESVSVPSDSSSGRFFLLNFENPANPRYHSLPVDEVLCLLRHRRLSKECRSLVFRRFRRIHASQTLSEELLASSGNLIVCLAQVGAALFPGKPGARMSVRLIRKFHEGMAISRSNLLLVQQILLLQAKSSHFKSCSTQSTKNMLNLQHARILSSIYPFPPTPLPTGKMPEVYFLKLPQPLAAGLRSNLTLSGYGQAITSANDRILVRKICQDAGVDPLAAYVVAMAWGGQDLRGNFQNTLQTLKSQTQIRTLLAQLRVSINSRDVDFALIKAASQNISGLGISFYPKLLYFFRPTPDAYILDTWTAMASYLLFIPQPIRLDPPNKKTGRRAPKANTTPQEYDQFCAEIDTLPGFLWPGLSMPGDVAEMAMFGVPPIPGDNSKKWREYVESHFPPPTPRQPKSKGTPKAPSSSFLPQLYIAHMASGQTLPAPIGLISKPALTTPWSAGGIRWVYDPAGNHVRVYKHYKPGTGVQTYQSDLSKTTMLRILAQANGWAFITIKGKSPGIGFKIKGNTTSKRARPLIIAKCLQAMETLLATIP